MIRKKAFAKINLGLRVLGRREDGYHELSTVFTRVGLADELEFKLRNDGKIAVEVVGQSIPLTKNLVYRAAKKLQKFAPKNSGVSIRLTKKIPAGAGLGGGSSDAATTLKFLDSAWGLKFSVAKLREIAAELGSDVSFFLTPGVQSATGRGEVLTQISLPADFPRHAVLVCPSISISTPQAFADLQLPAGQISRKKNSLTRLQNDFEKTVFEIHPQLQKIKKQLQKLGAKQALLTGSGSAVFGLFDSQTAARKTSREMRDFGEVFVTQIRG